MSVDQDKAFEFIPAPRVPLTFHQFYDQRWAPTHSRQPWWHRPGERVENAFSRLGDTFAEYADYLAAFMISQATPPAPPMDPLQRAAELSREQYHLRLK